MSDKPKFCTAFLHYIGPDDATCACRQLRRVAKPSVPCDHYTFCGCEAEAKAPDHCTCGAARADHVEA